MDLRIALSIAYVHLVRKVRRFSVGFNLSYHLFLSLLIASIPSIAVMAFGLGALHRVLNPQLAVTDFGLWIAAGATGSLIIFLGSRRKQLDAPLASVLPGASWRFYHQRGCNVLTYMLGRFFLAEISKCGIIILLALGAYMGFVTYGSDAVQIEIFVAIFLCPLFIVLIKVCYDLLVLSRRYEGGSLVSLRVCIGTLMVSLFFLVFYVARSIVLSVSVEGSNLWEFVARRLDDDLSAVLLVVALLSIALVLVVVQVARQLKTVRWAKVVEQQLEKSHIFKRLPELSLLWFKAIAIVDWRRTRRSFYERMLPTSRVLVLFLLIIIGGILWKGTIGDIVLPSEFPPIEIIVSCGLGTSQALIVCAAVSSVFSMGADRYAYMLWRNTDRGFERVLMTRAGIASVLLYLIGVFAGIVFLIFTGLTYMVLNVSLCIAGGSVIGIVAMLLITTRRPRLDWKETTEIDMFGVSAFIYHALAPFLLLGVAYSSLFISNINNLQGQGISIGVFLLAFVPVASAGLSLVGYRVLRKGIRAC